MLFEVLLLDVIVGLRLMARRARIFLPRRGRCCCGWLLRSLLFEVLLLDVIVGLRLIMK